MKKLTFQKVLLALVFLLVGFGFGMFFRYLDAVDPEDLDQAAVPTYLPSNIPQSSLWLETDPSEYTSTSIPIDVYLGAEENRVTGVQLEISYDPTVLRFVSVDPVDLLIGKQELIKKVDEKSGRITYASGVLPGQPVIQGTDEIVKLVFQPVGSASQTRETEVKILPESLVSAQGVKKSVLVKTTNIDVVLQPTL